ncbi:hypothetical protein [Streptomyces sp. HUAS TT20]|uniref:hypothetical protein n=1 Tax=Streptomyces sp. HUAS TT20 TaxID=3447509 RepID=UPI0021DA93B3|nr:hypothetical protein [Streptomyces sp. HUAS 15-9]UXY31113.1 hypothetical protein N8I87_34215 [Streptomyces sp. HUAS 15-9]
MSHRSRKPLRKPLPRRAALLAAAGLLGGLLAVPAVAAAAGTPAACSAADADIYRPRTARRPPRAPSSPAATSIRSPW